MAEKKSAGVAAAGPAVKKVHSHARGMFKRAQTMVGLRTKTAEADRLRDDESREKNWKRWGPYLSERQWATVREDYSQDGSWYVHCAIYCANIDRILHYLQGKPIVCSSIGSSPVAIGHNVNHYSLQ